MPIRNTLPCANVSLQMPNVSTICTKFCTVCYLITAKTVWMKIPLIYCADWPKQPICHNICRPCSTAKKSTPANTAPSSTPPCACRPMPNPFTLTAKTSCPKFITNSTVPSNSHANFWTAPTQALPANRLPTWFTSASAAPIWARVWPHRRCNPIGKISASTLSATPMMPT